MRTHVTALLMLLPLFIGCGCNRFASDSGRGAVARYVGGEACRSCHETEYSRWRGSHHDLAMQPASAETVLGDFDDASFTYGSTVSTFYRRNGQFFVRTDGPGGELSEFRISYTFGVTPLQQYLVEFPDGRLQTLPIAWDSRTIENGGQRWFHLYPDEAVTHEDPLHWTRPLQNWNHMCAECHSTNLQKGYVPSEDRFETSWTDIDVSCEACHGPGSRHVELAEDLKEGEEPPEEVMTSLTVRLRASDLGAWTMDSESGTARRDSSYRAKMIDVCAPCHSRRSTISQQIVPGRPFLDTHRPALLEDGLYYADGQILDEVYVYGSFVQSKMYAAGVTCSNCHDSHGMQLIAEGNALCAPCHLASKFDTPAHHFHRPDSTGGPCVACHMPSKVYMGVDARRDHSMRVPRPDLTLEVGSPNACNSCHTDRTPAWAAAFMEEWYGPEAERPMWADAISGGRRRNPESVQELAAMVADSTLSGIIRATAVRLLGDYPNRSTVPAMQRAAEDASPLVRLASAQAAAARGDGASFRVAVPLLYDSIRAVRSEAVQILAAAPPGSIPDQHAVAFERALAEFRETLQLHADRPESHVSLALIDAAAGRYSDAERSLRTAIRLDPTSEVAYVNLADVLRVLGRDSDGERVLRAGLRMSPESAPIRHSLGLLLVRAGNRNEALDELSKAADLAPESPRFAYAYAVGLHSAGETRRAVEVLTNALTLHPYDIDILSALATLSLELGRREQAMRYARQLASIVPRDEAVSDFVRSLEDR